LESGQIRDLPLTVISLPLSCFVYLHIAGGPLLLRETMTEKGREAEVETGVKKGKGGVEVGIGERE
jgi:hypothetical protein